MPLVDTGLVARYYLDEAASGASPTQANDASANAYHLTEINYGASSELSWTEASGNRGLISSSTTGTQRARRTINDTSDACRDAMASTMKGTIEVVISVTTFNASGSRIFGINNRTGGNGTFMLRGVGASLWQMCFNDTAQSNFTDSTSGRHVLTIVVDTTQATQNDRIRYSINGGTLAQETNTLTLNQTLTMPSGLDLIAFNREAGGSVFDRSFVGTLFYAALYSDAMSQTDITANYNILTADDDTPSGAAPRIITPIASVRF
jgi:hypothetical protein